LEETRTRITTWEARQIKVAIKVGVTTAVVEDGNRTLLLQINRRTSLSPSPNGQPLLHPHLSRTMLPLQQYVVFHPASDNSDNPQVTVTEVAPCDKNNVVTATAYVTTCPGGAPPPPPAGETCTPCAGMWPAPPPGAGGLGNCPVLTTSGLMLGLTAIPKNQAVQTGVTVAGPAPVAAAAATSGASSPDLSVTVTESTSVWLPVLAVGREVCGGHRTRILRLVRVEVTSFGRRWRV
jgi:hypothetical protein